MLAAGPSAHTAGATFASSDPGFEAQPVEALLSVHEALLARTKLCFGADRSGFESELMPLVRGYARFVHLLPATVDNYFAAPGGLLQLGLETAFFSLQGTDAHIFSGRATISERRELEPRWRIATFIGGLCCELHRALSHVIVTTGDGEEWPALLGGLGPWLHARQAARYYLRWRPKARESRGLGLFALPHVVPAEILQHLGQGNSVVLPQLLASIAGVPQHRDHNVLDELVRRSMALVIDRNLLANADRCGAPQYGYHLERYLVDAMRRLAAGHSAWIPNRDKSRVWLDQEGLFLAWPGAAEDVLGLLERDQLAGIPKSPQTLLEVLVDAEVFMPAGDAGPTWTLHPPGSRTPIEAVRLANAALLFHGLDPAPTPLTHRLLQSAQPVATPKLQPATEAPRRGAKPPADTVGPETQMSLLDRPPPSAGTEAEEVPGATSAPASPIVRPTIALRAPLRLNAAVRSALAEAIGTLNDGARNSQLCTVAEGVFVPLAALEQRGVHAGIAIRALADVRMLHGPSQNGLPPTVTRELPGGTVQGVIVRACHLEGLDPAAFIDTDADLFSGSPSGRSA